MRYNKEVLTKMELALADAEYFHGVANMVKDRYFDDTSIHHSVRRTQYRIWADAHKRRIIALNRAQLFNQLLA